MIKGTVMRKAARLLAPVALLAAVTPCTAQEKKRVAIVDFDYATVYSNAASIFGSNRDIGKGIANLLTDKLVGSGVYSVIERSALDRVLAEQNFSNSDRADPAAAARIGKVLGVDAIIMGAITQFGRDDETRSVSGLGRAAGRFGVGGVGTKTAKAVVEVSARMIDTSTAEIIAVASGKGESTRSGTTLLGGGGSPRTIGAGAADMSSKNFAATLIGEAVHGAVNRVAMELDRQAPRLPQRARESVEGLVADVSGDTIILNVGTRAGIRLVIRRVVREVTDPATGQLLRKITQDVGVAVITEADEVSSVGEYAGDQPAQVGDTVVIP